jgi:hypothetical protein
MASEGTKTVGLHFIISIEVEADSEGLAIMRAAPEATKIEDVLNRAGYPARLDEVRVRRPGMAEKAKAREAARRKEAQAG